VATAYLYVWWGNLTNRKHLEDLSVVGRIILKFIFKWWGVARTENLSFKIGTNGGLLRRL
jgi:hypothetical protein